MGAHRQLALLTAYYAFDSAAAQRFDLLRFPLPLVQRFTIIAAGAAAKSEEYQIDKHSALTQVPQSVFFDRAIDKLLKRFLFLFHRQRRIFFFFDTPKKKKMGG